MLATTCASWEGHCTDSVINVEYYNISKPIKNCAYQWDKKHNYTIKRGDAQFWKISNASVQYYSSYVIVIFVIHQKKYLL